MSSSLDEAIPSHQTVLGCGQLCLDYLVTVPSFPIPDQKIRGTSFKVDEDTILCSRRWKYWECFNMRCSFGFAF
ncbi:unnamed protein product [Microthlaspi erraticum]|uniref:Uncharacterized protein n=1 Tax=Microthlaspi erraticum TaxID=1685480 RepID=A0A6D2HW81_9BRAS|nr:unnamed protein product [Microthlaspi erraticum]